jgi:hypothetical protein
MSSAGWLFPARRMALLGVAALLATGVASAQVATSSDTSREAAVSATPSPSSDSRMFSDSNDGADPAAIPAAPSPANGQYDNSAEKAGHSWKDRVAFEGAGGFNVPLSDTSPYLNTGFNFTVGGGLHFDRYVTLLTEYQFVRDGLPSALITQAGANGGYANIWSFTVDPVINLIPKSKNDVYVTGGGGFYRKVTNFTDPQPVQYCTYFYCGIGYQNQVVGHFSSNQGGWNVGGGVSHRFAGFYNEGRMQVFAEVRYLDIMTPAVTASPNGLGVTTVGAGTKLIPITFGIRY